MGVFEVNSTAQNVCEFEHIKRIDFLIEDQAKWRRGSDVTNADQGCDILLAVLACRTSQRPLRVTAKKCCNVALVDENLVEVILYLRQIQHLLPWNLSQRSLM